MTTMPSVSAIIPVFNGERTIARAIDSALAQEFDGGIEIIVVNDGSTDATTQILRSYGDRIIVIDQPNRGLAVARNVAARNSSGEYLTFLDADDQWMPGKLAVQLPMLAGRADCAMIYSDAIQIDSCGTTVYDFYTPPSQRHAPQLKEMLTDPWNILPSTAIVPRRIFEKVGGFCEEFKAPFCEDAWFYLNARELGEFIYIERPLVQYLRSSPAEHFAKRFGDGFDSERLAAEDDRLRRHLANYDILIRLVCERYRAEARRFIRVTESSRINFLVGLGLTEMARGNRNAARAWYRRALAYDSWNAKTYARFLWTLLPDCFRRVISCLLSASIVRSLSGPAFG